MPKNKPTRTRQSANRAERGPASPSAPSLPSPTIAGMVPVRRPIRAKQEQLNDAVAALNAARGVWQEATARLDITSPMDEDYTDVVTQVERATAAYLAAGQILARVVRKV